MGQEAIVILFKQRGFQSTTKHENCYHFFAMAVNTSVVKQ